MRFPAGQMSIALVILLAAASPRASAESTEQSLTTSPAQVILRGRLDRQQLLVHAVEHGRPIDVTTTAKFQTETPQIISVDAAGVVVPLADGDGVVVANVGEQSVRITVKVVGTAEPLAVDFRNDILPILTRAGCNAGACHGKARGQNGFQLSLLGFDPKFDYEALAKEGRGRRVFLPDAERSLLLLKPTGKSPHGGGKRLEAGSQDYRVLLSWIEAGMPERQADAPSLVGVRIDPAERIMGHNATQRVIVTADYSDGTSRDVTHLAAYQSNESAIAAVDAGGLVETSDIVGEAAIMARFMGEIAVSTLAVPLAGEVDANLYANLPRKNFIDEHVWTKLQRLGITPSEQTDDATFLRRASIDIIGLPPTPAETREFLSDQSPNKREAAIDKLLKRPEYGDFWANKWVDLLRPNPYRVGIKAVLNYDNWIRTAFRQNKPYDQFVRELVTAKGSTFRDGSVTLFRDRREPDELTTIVSQLFLGIRLECAKCHHHPFEKWAQDDFYSFAAYFSRIGFKGVGLSPPISGSEELIFAADSGTVYHPLTGAAMSPRPLFGTAPEVTAESDPRESLAAWMTSPENPFFAQVIVNRVWADLMGRGIVEPVDDLRATNPPSNEALLTSLADDFRADGYDLKKLIRRITTSHVYGLNSIPNERNIADTRNYSRHYRQRLRAEVLLDTVCQITGVPEKFDAMPAGSKATAIWTHRVDSLFLDAFGRPDPNQDPPCERTTDTSMVQALHLMNSQNLYSKATSDSGLAAKLAATDKPPEQLAEELYLAVYCRQPAPEELAVAVELFNAPEADRRQTAEDLLWALLNTPEFVFKD